MGCCVSGSPETEMQSMGLHGAEWRPSVKSKMVPANSSAHRLEVTELLEDSIPAMFGETGFVHQSLQSIGMNGWKS